MHKIMKLAVFALTTSLLIGTSAVLYAQNKISSQFQVHVTIQESCNFSSDSATDLDFGTINRAMQSGQSQTNLRLKCTSGTPYTIKLNNNAVMVNTQNNNLTVPYTLYQDINHTKTWTGATPYLGTGDTQTIPVWGTIQQQATNVPAGQYNDTVTAVVSY